MGRLGWEKLEKEKRKMENEKTIKKTVVVKDYKLKASAWWSERNEGLVYPVKVYEVREKAINALFFVKGAEGEKDKPVYKWLPISQTMVRGDYSKLEKLVDVINHYQKCEIKNDFIKDNNLDVPINDFAIEKATDKALYLVKDDFKKWVPKNCAIVEIPLSIVINKLDIINKLGFINDNN